MTDPVKAILPEGAEQDRRFAAVKAAGLHHS